MCIDVIGGGGGGSEGDGDGVAERRVGVAATMVANHVHILRLLRKRHVSAQWRRQAEWQGGLSRTFASWHITIHEMQFRSKRKRTQSY